MFDEILEPAVTDETVAFLPLGHGDSAVVIGPASNVLLKVISEVYGSVEQIPYLSSDTTRIPPSIDLLLFLWPCLSPSSLLHSLDTFQRHLSTQTRIVIVDIADRPMLTGQALTAKMFQLWREYLLLRDGNIPEPKDHDKLLSSMIESGFQNLRTKYFTDPDLLGGSDSYITMLDSLQDRIKHIDNSRKGKISLLEKANSLAREMTFTAPETPPFSMLTATFPSQQQGSSTRITIPHIESEIEDYFPPVEIREEPSERLRLMGVDYLRSSELLSLALQNQSTVQSRETSEDLARRILSEYGTRALAAERNPGRLAELLGVPVETASQIVAIIELGRRFFQEPDGRTPYIRSPEDAHGYLVDMASLKKEHLRGLYLNVQSRLIHDEVISIGTLSRSIIHPREVFAPAVEHSAHALILAHNHPSGELTPSDNDILVTRQIAEAGRIMGIELIDHLIIGTSGFISFKKKKLL
jgi:DNA repair protein RadC